MFLLLEFDFIIVLSMYYIHLIIIKRMINITLVLLPRSHHTALTSNHSHISHGVTTINNGLPQPSCTSTSQSSHSPNIQSVSHISHGLPQPS